MLDGDHFVVNGQKVWTSGAHDADVLLAFVRTDPDAPKHKGISALLIPTDSPGVTCRPFACVYDRDDLDFNEVFLTDVRVPAENLVGPLGGGWKVANGSLGHERTMMWLQFANRLGQTLRELPARRRVAARPVRDASRWTIRRCACWARRRWRKPRAARATPPGCRCSRCSGRRPSRTRYRHVLEAAGVDGLADPAMTAPYNPYSPGQFTAGWFTRYIGSFAGTIAGGTSEIQRNIIAQHVLRLPAR